MRKEALIQALTTTAGEIEELEERLLPLKARRDDLVLQLRGLEDPPPIREVAEVARISNPRVTQLENASRERSRS